MVGQRWTDPGEGNVTTLQHRGTGTATATGRTVAEYLQPIVHQIFGGPPPVEISFWDGSHVGAGGPGRIVVRGPDALRRLIWAPGELGLARAFVAGDLDVTGDLADMLRVTTAALSAGGLRAVAAVPAAISAAKALGLVSGAPPAPPEEIVPHGVRHSIRRDKQAVSHHYDVGNAFYEMVLGPSMTYSCARFVDASTTLEEAQAAKQELICRKLGLDDESFRQASSGPRPRVLDVGCGWGSMAIHAATHHDVDVVGVTISEEQAAYARRRVADLGRGDRVEIRIQDYRTIRDGPFDAISSIGMAEHVGHKRMRTYFETLHELLRPGGRLLNHAISSVGGARMAERGFIHRYVFPDGELLDVGVTALEMEQAGFEVRDVENLREHYATTLRHWVANLERNWTDAVGLVGEGRARVWRLYMSGSINGFEEGRIQLHQTLGVRAHPDGRSEMPPTRRYWD
jgi:cyclopropane-fatty-acyl-phospholipid synthase